MMILALEKQSDTVDQPSCAPFLEEEARRVWEIYCGGALRQIFFRADRRSAVLILECESVEAARELLDSLPLVREGLIGFELIPLAPYPGFGRLFKEK